MIQVGVFAKVFDRPTLAGVFDALAAGGFRTTQFNMSCAGVADLPDDAVNAADLANIRREAEVHKIELSAVSGTYNMISPDVQVRRDGLRRLRVLAAACAGMGTSLITLCTGSRDAQNMWRWHADNASLEAWHDLITEMRQAVAIADEFDVTLGVEPEGANVIADAHKARRLMDELGSPRVKIIMDGANLFHDLDFSHQQARMDEAFAFLHKDIVSAHAKDLVDDGHGHIEWRAAGLGSLDYTHYLRLLKQYQFDGALLLHGLNESQVEGCAAMLRHTLESLEQHE